MHILMAPPTYVTFLAIVLITVLFLKTILPRRRRRAYNLPPGPKPWPIIGNLHLMGALPHRSIHELSKRYGRLMQLRFGSSPVVVGSSPEMARFFLKTHDAAFCDRPSFSIGRHTTYGSSDIMWSQYGAYLRQARRICSRRLESFGHIRDEEVRGLLRGLQRAAASSGSGRGAVRLRDHQQMATLGVVSRVVLGRKYVQDQEEAPAAEGAAPPFLTPAEFRETMEELFVLNGVFNIGDLVPWLERLDLQGYVRRMKRASKRFDPFLNHILDEHNKRRWREGEGFVARDMVDVLLQMAGDPNLEVNMSRDNVKAITLDMILGGTDTSSMTIEWAISELLKNPKLLANATEELDRVVGRERLVTERDFPNNLPYMEAILKETLRLHPVAPMLAPHLCRQDTSVDGYDIPTGTIVFVNVWSIGRDPILWDAPEKFYPERFLESKIDVRGQDFELLPFGSGRRMCPGFSLGMKVTLLSIANLVHGFTWRLPDGMTVEELSMEEAFKLAMPRKVPLEAVVKPRLPVPGRMYAGA